MTEGPIGFEPKIDSAEPLQPLKVMEYPPNAAFFFAMLSPPSRRSLERKRNRVHLPCRMPKGNLAARRLRSGRGYYRRFTRGKKEKNTIRGGGPPRRGRGGGDQPEDGLTLPSHGGTVPA